MSPRISPHSSLREKKFVTWNSLWEHPRLSNHKSLDFDAHPPKTSDFELETLFQSVMIADVLRLSEAPEIWAFPMLVASTKGKLVAIG